MTPGPPVDGPRVDGPPVDGPPVDGPRVDGPRVGGPGTVDPPVRVALVGAGALGQLVGALLHRAGRTVPTILSRRPEAVAAIRAAGIEVTDRLAGTVWTARPAARVADEAPEAAYDLVLLLVKSHDVERAVRLAGRVATGDGAIVALQNGLRPAAVVERADPRGVAGAIYLGARYVAPGRVEHTAAGPLVVAPAPARAARVAGLVGALHPAVPVQVGADRDAVLWGKLARAVSNLVSGALAVPVWALDRSPASAELLARVRAEVLAVAAARGVPLDGAALARAAGPAAPYNVGSTYQSLLGGRPAEAVELAGDVEAAGAEVGVPTPVTTGLRLLLLARTDLALITPMFP